MTLYCCGKFDCSNLRFFLSLTSLPPNPHPLHGLEWVLPSSDQPMDFHPLFLFDGVRIYSTLKIHPALHVTSRLKRAHHDGSLLIVSVAFWLKPSAHPPLDFPVGLTSYAKLQGIGDPLHLLRLVCAYLPERSCCPALPAMTTRLCLFLTWIRKEAVSIPLRTEFITWPCLALLKLRGACV